MNNNLENPFYYLENFRFVLDWVGLRYADLLADEESGFINKFSNLPIQSQALLVRMVMRRGNLFRASKLNYDEIGDPHLAAEPLIAQGWIAADPLLALDQLFGVLTKTEFAGAVELPRQSTMNKTTMLELAQQRCHEMRQFSAWCADLDDVLFEVCVTELIDRLRLMFFGNLHQDWSEFVLADLGIFKYEKVPFSKASRAFHTQSDIDFYLHLYACRERLQNGEALEDIEQCVQAQTCSNPWLQQRQARLQFQIGQEYERQNDYVSAERVYSGCLYADARLRLIRVLEKQAKPREAFALAQIAWAQPGSAQEHQHLSRIMPRLQKKLRLSANRKQETAETERINLVLVRADDVERVEEAARRHIESLIGSDDPAPVFYVENALINSLFGLLCWDAIFSPVSGAFFHPFQTGPADLHSVNFRSQRADLFQQLLSQLDTEEYLQTIRSNFKNKSGIQSPFVFWGFLDQELLELSLACLPATHLKKFFDRILDGIAANRSGFPDLIQFWPQQKTYRMIEVKGPGDRLQDNQLRFIDFCQQHQIPVAVCYVEWESTAS